MTRTCQGRWSNQHTVQYLICHNRWAADNGEREVLCLRWFHKLLVFNMLIIDFSPQGACYKESGGSGTDAGGLTGLLFNPQLCFSLTKDVTHEVHRQQVPIKVDPVNSRLALPWCKTGVPRLATTSDSIWITLFKLNMRIHRLLSLLSRCAWRKRRSRGSRLEERQR